MKKKFLRGIICLAMVASLSVFGYSYKQVNALTITFTQADEQQLKSMTLSQLKSAAVPVPAGNITTETDDMGVKHKVVHSYNTFPENNSIYVLNDNGNLSYYKFAYLSDSPTKVNYVEYNIYQWIITKDGRLLSGLTSEEYSNSTLYNQIKQDLSNIDNSKPSGKNYTTKRLSGSSRFETSNAIANEFSTGTVENVIITTANNFPDALSGSTLAKKLNAPILLVGNNAQDSSQTLDYIKTHLDKSGYIYILGGEGVVNNSILDALKEQGFTNFKRLQGQDRYETCAAITNELNVPKFTPVILVTGEDFPDALSIAPFAAKNGYPIILTNSRSIPKATLDVLKKIDPNTIYIIGGVGAVSKQIEDSLMNLDTVNMPWGPSITRLSGTDRYDTSLKIAQTFDSKQSTSSVIFSTGENFPDALSGSTLATKLDSSIVLINDNNYSNAKSYIDSKPQLLNEIFLGGNGVISYTTIGKLSR